MSDTPGNYSHLEKKKNHQTAKICGSQYCPVIMIYTVESLGLPFMSLMEMMNQFYRQILPPVM